MAPLPRLDLVLYGLMPFLQAVVGLSLLGALYLAIAGTAGFWEGAGLWQLLFFYVLGFGGVIVGCVARGTAWGAGGALRGVLVAQVYAFYSGCCGRSWCVRPCAGSPPGAVGRRPPAR